MKKFLVLLLSIMLLAGIASAEEKADDILGNPFPDFTVTDTEGNAFILSEALKDHKAVLINFWATWCAPCLNEFPHLNEAYEKYSDRVAFIALSKEKKDTIEKITEYQKENGISFPMGRDEGQKLYGIFNTTGVPITVVVDRFGNVVFFQMGAFSAADAVERLLDAFLGDNYTETTVLDGIPRDTSTRSFPVSAARAIYPDSGNCRKVILHATSNPIPINGYIVPDDSVRLRIEFAAEDNGASMTYADMCQLKTVNVLSLLDPERGVYVYDQEMPDSSDEDPYIQVYLYDATGKEDEKEIKVCLFRNEEAISKFTEALKADGDGELTWEYADTEEKTENTPQAYIMHVMDQDSMPVPEVTVNFCTDEACVPSESDENGLITFDGEPKKYHVQIIDVPEGYSYDEDFEMYTAPVYSEWTLRIRKLTSTSCIPLEMERKCG